MLPGPARQRGTSGVLSDRARPYDQRVATHPFRFGLQVFSAESRTAWRDHARRAEDLGFDTVLVPDHLVGGVFSPMVALSAMAEATSTLRVGTLVLNNDLRHPAILAREAATLDLLTNGRLELGLGAGHAAPEYEAIGLAFDRDSVRVDRLGESLDVLSRLFHGDTVVFDGAHYSLHEHQLFPARRPTLLVGGNGDRVLRLAAMHADIVSLTGFGATRADGQQHATEWSLDQIDAKVAIIREAAGDRLAQLELNALVQQVVITTNRRAVIEATASRVGAHPDILATSPYMLVGTLDEVTQQLVAARERWGFSYFATRNAEAAAQIIAAFKS
jgi:probable F420-dependent oxidoreductase